MFAPQTPSFNPLSRKPCGMGRSKLGYRLPLTQLYCMCSDYVQNMSEKSLHIKISVAEMEALSHLAKSTSRTKSDIVRECLRTLLNIKPS